MELIRILIVFISILLTGYVMLSLIFQTEKVDLLEGLALIMALGAGTIGVLLFWLALLGIKPSFTVMFFLFVLSGIISFILSYMNKSASFAMPPKLEKKEIPILSIALILWVFLLSIVFIHSVMLPIFDVDAYGLWILKTKVLIHEGIYSKDFYFLPISYSHLNYPLMVPFLMSSFYCTAEEANDILCRIIFPIIYINITLLIYSTLKWKLKRIHSILLCLLFVSMPALLRWVGAGIADVPLTLFYAASVHYIVKYIKEQKKPDFILAVLFTLFSSFCKNEGIAIAGINIACFVFFNSFFPFRKDRLFKSIYFVCALGILLIPWYIWSNGVPHTHENYPSRLMNTFSIENQKRIIEIISLFVKHSLSFSMGIMRWGVLWLILTLAAIINYKKFKEKYVLTMWVLFILHIGAYFFVFIISPWPPKFLADMALERILLHASPALIYLIAYHMKDYNSEVSSE